MSKSYIGARSILGRAVSQVLRVVRMWWRWLRGTCGICGRPRARYVPGDYHSIGPFCRACNKALNHAASYGRGGTWARLNMGRARRD